MSAIAPPRPRPLLWALGASILLHAVGLSSSWPTPPRARAEGHTVSVFRVTLPHAAGRPSIAKRAEPPRAPTTQAPVPVRLPPSPSPSRPKTLPPRSTPPALQATPTTAAPLSAPATATAPSAPVSPLTAGLFGNITTQALGSGSWGRRRRPPDTEAQAQAEQAQQALALRAALQGRLAAMSEVMRQNQQGLDCHIRIQPSTRQAEVQCDPDTMQSTAWSTLQGLAMAGPVPSTSEALCIHWTPFETLMSTCPTEHTEPTLDIAPTP